ncbi:phosphodiester glycosidase family protein [Roseivivax isoporae]|uniref:Phosphodiester glycosidase domain-containing protein n=1 Tax=Roseivivax isoporae LMG 25204 TaxID=1449351 RepID=X7F6P8_9RHOB|nr:phosphodiester glycosidase family protein [Roseivivax isoporae]ETX28470.1 hypothetical protein RISW2_06145 [Roseivivax isoporae LMG 25204]
MRRLSALAAATLAALLGPSAADALECGTADHAGTTYTVCRVDLATDDLRLFLYRPDGAPWGQFTTLDAALAEDGKRLAFAMNAGMYHSDRRPVGLYVEDGEKAASIVPNPGPGNFGLVPNGVFCFGEGNARVIETRRFIDEAPACRYATQSGPMLVIDGDLHPRFLTDSTSRYIRNGVGTTGDGTTAIFAISESPVTFHEFGTLFRDVLGTDQALFLDGNISRLHAPAQGRSDFGRTLGPIVGVVAPRD